MRREGVSDLVFRVVEDLYRKTKKPVTIKDITKYLASRELRFGERTVRYALDRLIGEGRVVRVRKRPLSVIPGTAAVGLEVYLESPRDSGEVTSIKEEEEWGGERALAKHLIDDMEQRERFLEAVRDNAVLISEEDPVEVLTEFAAWLADRYNSLLQEYGSAVSEMKKERINRKILKVLKLVNSFFRSVLSVPVYEERLDEELLKSLGDLSDLKRVPWSSKVSPIAIAAPSPSGSGVFGYMAVHRPLLRKVLEKVIIGRKIVERRPLADPESVTYVSGHDTSYWPVRVGDIARSLFRTYTGPPLFVFAGIIYRTWKLGRVPRAGGGTDVAYSQDIIPKPAELPVMDHETAVSEGYVLTPDLLDLVPEGMVRRTVEAQMNVLEYSLMLLLLRRAPLKILDQTGSPFLPPNVLLHDGRIFPYEHKLDDFVYTFPHGNIVRNSISKFLEVVKKADEYAERTTVVGVVKRVGVPTLLPLIAWILLKHGIIGEDVFWRTAVSPSLEQEAVSYLFSGLMKAEGIRGRRRNVVLRTFAVVRSLWSMDDKLASAFSESADSPEDAEDPSFWLDRASVYRGHGLRRFIQSKGLPPGPDEVFADVLSKARVAVFYYCPPVRSLIEGVVLPRMEVLLPFSRRDLWERKVDSVLLDFIPRDHQGVRLFGYEIYPIGQDGWDKYLILPDHVYRAHQYATIYDADLRSRYLSYIERLVAKIVKRRMGA